MSLKGNQIVNKPIKLEIKYKDENGKEYVTKEEYLIGVIEIPWYAKIVYLFKGLFS